MRSILLDKLYTSSWFCITPSEANKTYFIPFILADTKTSVSHFVLTTIKFYTPARRKECEYCLRLWFNAAELSDMHSKELKSPAAP